ncbi:MAG: transcription elongation factor GreB [Bdellovibrionales bacterium]|nr:transcription elongation factor GreB [Bdellovibrionales bacterium]
MSKAFTKEDSGVESPADEAEEEGTPLPRGSKNYMTPPGAERLRSELRHLLNEARPEVVRTVSWAASNGDRSENGDYIYGKKRLREIDRRIRFLQRRLDQVEVVDPKQQKGDRVLFGARVTVEDESGIQKTYRIVGIDEADPTNGDVSWISPIAKALLNTRVGEVISFRSPKGEEELEIVSVSFS